MSLGAGAAAGLGGPPRGLASSLPCTAQAGLTILRTNLPPVHAHEHSRQSPGIRSGPLAVTGTTGVLPAWWPLGLVMFRAIGGLESTSARRRGVLVRTKPGAFPGGLPIGRSWQACRGSTGRWLLDLERLPQLGRTELPVLSSARGIGAASEGLSP